jgi:ADP-heptose:LPS heptosyltransferase
MPDRPGMPDKLGAPKSIAILRALQLGDMLCAVPALRALRLACPAARITLIGLPWARDFTARFHRYLDDFIEFPGYPGLPERTYDSRAVTAFFAQTQARRFDLLLQMHGDGRISNQLVALIGASRSAGYYVPGEYCPDDERFLPWQAREHEVLRWLRLVERLGAPTNNADLEFPLLPDDAAQFEAIAERHSLHAVPFVCLHPGSQLASRRWPAERFARVGDRVSALGYRVVLTGTSAEYELTTKVARAMQTEPVNLAGSTTLGALAELIRHSAGLVCNDTGVSHIAAAVRTCSVVVSCGSDPARWAPLDSQLHRVVFAPVNCRPCSYRDCPYDHTCARAVSDHEVASTIESLLRRRLDRAHHRRRTSDQAARATAAARLHGATDHHEQRRYA